MAQWSVYVVRCSDGALYTGIATDVRRRIAEHGKRDGKGAKYLRGKGPLRLVFEQAVESKGLALKIESQIKKLPKARKEELIEKFRPTGTITVWRKNMLRNFLLVLLLLTLGCVSAEGAEPPLALDHVWIFVTSGAPEREALEKAGFLIAPDVSRHDGQGTASVTVEFLNRYLELIYLDKTVQVAPGMEVAVKKFQARTAWRESGASPFGIGTRRTPSTPPQFPFPTWRVTVEWMPKGAFMEMLTPREMLKAPSLFVTAEPLDEALNRKLAADPVKGKMFLHPNGARRLTGVRIVVPDAADLPPAASYLSDAGVAKFDVGQAWLMEVTLDDGKQGVKKDLRPDLPLVIHY